MLSDIRELVPALASLADEVFYKKERLEIRQSNQEPGSGLRVSIVLGEQKEVPA
jgi:hypothetical protein